MLLLILTIGWLVIGWYFAVGIALMIFGIAPLQLNLSKKFGGLRSKTARASDARVNATSQAIEGIRVVKMMGYENIFQERITSCRKDEIEAMKRVNWYKVSRVHNVKTYWFSPCLTFSCMLLSLPGHERGFVFRNKHSRICSYFLSNCRKRWYIVSRECLHYLSVGQYCSIWLVIVYFVS